MYFLQKSNTGTKKCLLFKRLDEDYYKDRHDKKQEEEEKMTHSTLSTDIQKMLTRRSIRKYRTEPIEEDKLQQILLAGLYAPSAGGRQEVIIVVSQSSQVNETLGRYSREMMFPHGTEPFASRHVSDDQPSIIDDLTIQSCFYKAPVVLTLFAKNKTYQQQDAAIAADHIMLAAHFLGIGSCYIGRTREVFATQYGQQLIQKWKISTGYEAICNVLLGYPQGEVLPPKPRKDGRIIRV